MPSRIKPYLKQKEEDDARKEQLHVYRRNQAFGVILLAVAICAWWLFHTNPRWVFPPGWWRP